MLHEFLATNREELEKRCRDKVATRSAPEPPAGEPEFGIPLFIGQLIDTLRSGRASEFGSRSAPSPADIGGAAGKHGSELFQRGFTIDQVVRDYGDLCQAITELADETKTPITVEEFHTFNRCLDDAIADAVTEFTRRRDESIAEEGLQTMDERLGFLAHELRNSLNAAMLAFEAIKSGRVALTGEGRSDRTGLGLGLSISRRGVAASGGKLHAVNRPGKGCVFTIDLPRSAPAE